MTVISALQNVHVEGSFGNFENKPENELLKIKELKNLLIVQVVQYKNSSIKKFKNFYSSRRRKFYQRFIFFKWSCR
mgnify:CR=1 FL=1